jgi:hypothetical protein
MNCSPSIAIALLLLSLTAGMFLLYKTQKENLNTFFKVISWFIIVASFCSMICCTMRCVMHGCSMRQECREMEACGPGGESMEECHGGFNKRVMIFHGEGDGGCQRMRGCCNEKMECGEGHTECEEGKTECSEGEKKCCDKDKKCEMKMEMKKDTVIIKKR